MREGWPATLANLPIAAISALVVRPAVDDRALAVWFAIFAAVVSLRIAISILLPRHGVTTERQLLAQTAGTTAAGLMWGALPMMMIGSADFVHFGFCSFIAAGMTAGALPALSWYRPAYLGYLFATTLPLAAALLLHGGEVYLAMGILVAMYAGLLPVTARGYNRTLVETLQLRGEVDRLGYRLLASEDQLSRADDDKWRTMAHLSHELRTPLNAVLGFSDILRGEQFGPLGDRRYADYASAIHGAGSAILQLVEDLLELSTAQSGALTLTRERVRCADLLQAVLARHGDGARAAGVTIDTRLIAAAVHADLDPGKAGLALDNLIDNAVRYTPPGGRIWTSLDMDSRGAAVITIADTGLGMSPAQIRHALEPFGRVSNPLISQGHRAGLGLGLPLARRLVELHGASFDIRSQPGNGTTVTLRFPPDTAATNVAPLRVA